MAVENTVTVKRLLLVLSFLSFVLATIGVSASVNLIALGLALLVLSMVIT